MELSNLVWDNGEDARNTAEYCCLSGDEVGGEATDGTAIGVDDLGGVWRWREG